MDALLTVPSVGAGADSTRWGLGGLPCYGWAKQKEEGFRGNDNDFPCVCALMEVGVEQPGAAMKLPNKEETHTVLERIREFHCGIAL